MLKIHITVLGYYRNSDTTKQIIIKCDGVNYSAAGVYEFFDKTENGYVAVAYYPIIHTIITKIEKL